MKNQKSQKGSLVQRSPDSDREDTLKHLKQGEEQKSLAFNLLKISLTSLITISLAFITIASAVGSYIAFRAYFQQKFEQEQKAILKYVKTLKHERKHSACVREAEKIPPGSDVYDEARILQRSCQNALSEKWLEQAQELAAKGRFAQAIATVSRIPQSDFYQTAQQLNLKWSNRVLEIAEEFYWKAQARPEEAIKIASAVPESSPVYDQAQKIIKQWQQEWDKNTELWQAAHKSLDANQFASAMNQAERITTDHAVWEKRRESTIQAIQERQIKKQHEDKWQEALSLLQQGEPQNAIHIANQLPDTPPWAERKAQIIERAESKMWRTQVCQNLSLGLWDCRLKFGSRDDQNGSSS